MSAHLSRTAMPDRPELSKLIEKAKKHFDELPAEEQYFYCLRQKCGMMRDISSGRTVQKIVQNYLTTTVSSKYADFVLSNPLAKKYLVD